VEVILLIIDITSTTLIGESHEISIDTVQVCPICSHGIIPEIMASSINDQKESNELSVIFYCPHCNNTFMSIYIILNNHYEPFTTILFKSYPV